VKLQDLTDSELQEQFNFAAINGTGALKVFLDEIERRQTLKGVETE